MNRFRVSKNRRRSGLWSTTLALGAAVAAALLATGTSYALWNGTAVVNASTVSSGTTSLTINGATNYTIPYSNSAGLSPGGSFVTPLTLLNTGTTKLSASVTSTTILAQTNGLQGYLTARLTQSSRCTAGLPGGLSGPLSSFGTASAPYLLPAGTALDLCLEVKLDAAAPRSVQNGSTSFQLNLDAVQVRG